MSSLSLPVVWIVALILLIGMPRMSHGADALVIIVIGFTLRLAMIIGTPGPVVGHQIQACLIDLLVLILVMAILRLKALEMRWALLHAANPLNLWMVCTGSISAAALTLAVCIVLMTCHLIFRQCQVKSITPETICLVFLCLCPIASQSLRPPSLAGISPLVAVQPGFLLILSIFGAGFSPEFAGSGSLPSPFLPHAFWALIYTRLFIALNRMRRRIREGIPIKTCRNVSVVVPALNEAGWIGACVDSLKDVSTVIEVIVVDGGSTDRTASIAATHGAKVILHQQALSAGDGRGGQIREGIELAVGDVVAVVHADVRVPPSAFSRMLEMLNRNPASLGGAVGCRFDGANRQLRIIDFANDARMAFSGVAFGDQVQFFRRAPVVQNTLFPAIPLMEDVEFSLGLMRYGSPLFLFEKASVSSRRWKYKAGARAWKVICFVALYLLQRLWKTPDTAEMYERYYHL